MDWKPLALTALLLAFFSTVLPAQEEETPPAPPKPDRTNNQTFVIGAGLGSHAFADPLRIETESGGLEIKSALMSQVYGEWYVLDTIGFGLRFISFGASTSGTATVTVNGTTETVKDEINVDVTNWLATVQWIPIGGQGYWRIGVLGGLGASTIEVESKTTPGSSDSESTSGPAQLLGAFVDWGGEDFGARFGLQYLATQLDDIGGQDVDASGSEWYFDLRWAF